MVDDARRVRVTDAEIGRRIRRRRLEMGLTQEQLGEMVGATQQDLSAWEKGNRTVPGTVLVQLVTVMDCDVPGINHTEER